VLPQGKAYWWGAPTGRPLVQLWLEQENVSPRPSIANRHGNDRTPVIMVRLAWMVGDAGISVVVTHAATRPLFESLADRWPLEIRLQQGGDLGQRMYHALQSALRQAAFAVLIGTDCPAMNAAYLQRACQPLDDGSAVVLGPADDGGYVLIGVRSCDERLFRAIPWGSNRVLQLTRERLRALQLRHTELDSLWDLDRPEDLRRWRSLVSAGSA